MTPTIAIGFYAVVLLIAVPLSILWLFVPFAIFGTKAKLEAISVELRRLNANLEAAQRRSS